MSYIPAQLNQQLYQLFQDVAQQTTVSVEELLLYLDLPTETVQVALQNPAELTVAELFTILSQLGQEFRIQQFLISHQSLSERWKSQ